VLKTDLDVDLYISTQDLVLHEEWSGLHRWF